MNGYWINFDVVLIENFYNDKKPNIIHKSFPIAMNYEQNFSDFNELYEKFVEAFETYCDQNQAFLVSVEPIYD